MQKQAVSTSTVNRGQTVSEEHIRRLWTRMQMLFGYRWFSAYGPEDDGTWLAVLGDLPPQAIADGLRELRDRLYEWPPAAAEFRRLCLGLPSVEEYVADRDLDGGYDHRRLDARTSAQIRSERRRIAEARYREFVERETERRVSLLLEHHSDEQ